MCSNKLYEELTLPLLNSMGHLQAIIVTCHYGLALINSQNGFLFFLNHKLEIMIELLTY
jgi:hypothetical protein